MERFKEHKKELSPAEMLEYEKAAREKNGQGPSAIGAHVMAHHGADFKNCLSFGLVARGKSYAGRHSLGAYYCYLNECKLNRRDEGRFAVIR